jgi:serine/threonine protein kinase
VFVLAPEVITRSSKHTPYAGRPVDIWALGIILYQFIYGRVPFKGSNVSETFQAIAQNQFIFITFINYLIII